MITPNNPYGGVNPLIDKMIGNAYDVVKYVASHLKAIRYVAENMDKVYEVVHGYRHVYEATGTGSSSLAFHIPSELNSSTIQGISMIAIDGDQVYVPGPDTFEFGLSNTEIVVTIHASFLNSALYRTTVHSIQTTLLDGN